MKQSPAILNALRAAGLMAIIIVGLVSIIGTDTIAAILPQTGTASGASARNSLSEPHSSASKCEKPI